MRPSTTIITLVMCAASCGAGPAEAVTLAFQDLRDSPEEIRPYVRYLSATEVPAKERELFGKVLSFVVNGLSTDAEPTPPALVAPGLYRVDIRDYGWTADQWDKFAKTDPYFHESYKFRSKKSGKLIVRTEAGAWLPTKEISGLVLGTESEAPIIRADWFIVEVSQQDNRKGTGYYDFLNVKSRDDFDKLVGVDKKLAIRMKREIKAIIARSTVAINNRQIARFQAVTGPYWVTLDVNNNVGNRNAKKNLDKDYKHDAEEIYATLPNGLPANYLSSAAGVQQNSAPDNIASDGLSPTPDRRVHANHSCVRCHTEVIRPIDDWARQMYTPPLAIQSPDYEIFRRLRQLYVADLQRWIHRDQADFAEAIARVNGLKPADNAKAFAAAWARYAAADLDIETAAIELGTDAKRLEVAIAAHAQGRGQIDSVIGGFLHKPPLKVRREHWEESYALFHKILREVQAP